jgi:murein DD-endopeptidase MepM/ murein hydrolase activator NlpD
MGVLQGKGIWTLYDDVDIAVAIAPVVGAKYILCKISKRGKYDPDSAKKALDSVKKNPNLVPVAWTYSYLEAPAAESECLQRALKDGFEAVIIDAEGDVLNKFTQAQDLVDRVLGMNLDLSRIYLCGDPRLNTKMDIFPYAILAKICRGGFMPMTYGEILPSDHKNSASVVLTSAYNEYERHKTELNYTTPLLPIIATYWDSGGKARMTRAEFQRWCDETEAHGPTFVSLYRAGVTIAEAWVPFKDLEVSATDIVVSPDGEESVLVQPNGAGYQVSAFPPNTPEAGWTEQFTDVQGNLVRVRRASAAQTMYATYRPALTQAGRYIVETFIPDTHATTKGAQYFVVFYDQGQRKENRVLVNQLNYSNQWVSLGTYDLDPKNADAGRVNLVDITSDDQPREIAFTAIRWRTAVDIGQGFDAPIGTAEERTMPQIWPGKWVDANPYLTKYGLGYHTGADLNLNFPNFNADKGKPVYAAGDGEVVFAQVIPESWRGLIVIKHKPLPDGKPVFSRYGHVENIMVKAGDFVKRGQQISTVGLFGPEEGQNYHLHFDISCTTILDAKNSPRHWPGTDLNAVKTHYVDPKKFIQDHRP